MNASLAWHDFNSSNHQAYPVLMLHGFMGCGSDWTPTAEALTPSFRSVCPDLPGHGDTRFHLSGADAGIEETAAALLRGLENRHIYKCALLGYSMGGRIALYLALNHPERFSCVVLESASPGLAEAEERQERLRQDAQLAARLEPLAAEDASDGSDGFKAFLREWYDGPLFRTLGSQPGLLEEMVGRRTQNNPRSLAASLRGLGTGSQPSLWEKLPSLALPVLLAAGEEDTKFRAIAAAMKARLPRAEYHAFPECSHCPHEERPASFAALLRTFLTRHTAGAG